MVRTLTAATARIVYGYHVAAELERCTIDNGEELVVTATVRTANPFYLSARPLRLRIPTRVKAIEFAIESVVVAGTSLTARLIKPSTRRV